MTDAPTPRDVIAKLMAGTFGDLCSMLPDADAILSALTAAGYVVAPREPTEGMVEAGWIDKEDVSPAEIWGAMIDAAPTGDAT